MAANALPINGNTDVGQDSETLGKAAKVAPDITWVPDEGGSGNNEGSSTGDPSFDDDISPNEPNDRKVWLAKVMAKALDITDAISKALGSGSSDEEFLSHNEVEVKKSDATSDREVAEDTSETDSDSIADDDDSSTAEDADADGDGDEESSSEADDDKADGDSDTETDVNQDSAQGDSASNADNNPSDGDADSSFDRSGDSEGGDAAVQQATDVRRFGGKNGASAEGNESAGGDDEQGADYSPEEKCPTDDNEGLEDGDSNSSNE
ncbi:hypothetical protein H4R35_001649 [Dimargaris xerosporica]|nr:hypothetical protein H4R35_001649 [Dimargaris xerosporica]